MGAQKWVPGVPRYICPALAGALVAVMQEVIGPDCGGPYLSDVTIGLL